MRADWQSYCRSFPQKEEMMISAVLFRTRCAGNGYIRRSGLTFDAVLTFTDMTEEEIHQVLDDIQL